MNDMLQQVFGYVEDYLYLIPAILISLTVHEYSHAFAAVKLGDPTPREDGRLSFNPFHHIDIFGFIVMLLVRFGWAKPVRVNPMFFENPRKGMMITALAGPISNLILCAASSLLFFFGFALRWPEFIVLFFYYMTMLNIGLAVFNLIPVHPLDGSRVLGYFAPGFASFMARNGNIVQMIFIALLILPGYLPIPDVLGGLIGFVQSGTARLFMRLWSLLFGFLF